MRPSASLLWRVDFLACQGALSRKWKVLGEVVMLMGDSDESVAPLETQAAAIREFLPENIPFGQLRVPSEFFGCYGRSHEVGAPSRWWPVLASCAHHAMEMVLVLDQSGPRSGGTITRRSRRDEGQGKSPASGDAPPCGVRRRRIAATRTRVVTIYIKFKLYRPEHPFCTVSSIVHADKAELDTIKNEPSRP